MQKLSSSIVLLTLLSACASPEVVDERELGDENLSCSQIKQEIAEAENFEKQARKEKEYPSCRNGRYGQQSSYRG